MLNAKEKPDAPAGITLHGIASAADVERLAAEISGLRRAIESLKSTGTPKLLVTEAEAGEMLGISGRSVFEMAARGELHAVFPTPQSKRYAVAELEQWIRQSQERPVAS